MGYNSFVIPILEYNDVLYYFCSIDNVQLEAAHSATDYKSHTSHYQLYAGIMGWTKLFQHRKK